MATRGRRSRSRLVEGCLPRYFFTILWAAHEDIDPQGTELPDDDAVDGWDECQCCKEEKRSITIWPDRPRGRRVLFAVSSLPCLSAIVATSTFPADWTARPAEHTNFS